MASYIARWKFLATLGAGIGRTKRSTRAVDDDQLIEK
jgi:hypothetical protein